MFLRYLLGIIIVGVVLFLVPALLREPNTFAVLLGVAIILALLYPIYVLFYKAIAKWRKETEK